MSSAKHQDSRLKQAKLAFGKRARDSLDADDYASNRAAEPPAKKTNISSRIAEIPPDPEMTSDASGRPLVSSSGPSTSDPFAINPPSFDLTTSVTTAAEPRIITKDPGLDLLLFTPFLRAPARTLFFEYLRAELPWYRVTYATRGMQIRTPRWTCVWGCDDTGALPAAYQRRPRAIPAALAALKTEVERRTGAHFNFVLCNYYADGKDSISWHSDDEKFLGPNPTIASLTLGAPRDFHMKPKPSASANDPSARTPVEKWTLAGGDMVVMRGTTQSRWLHSVPKRASAGGRMNITFRRAMTVAGTNNYYRYNVGDGPVHRWRNGEMVETS